MAIYDGCRVNSRDSAESIRVTVVGRFASAPGWNVGRVHHQLCYSLDNDSLGGREDPFGTVKAWAVLDGLMFAFEVSLGYAFGSSLDRILLDYNMTEGRFMIFGMLFMLLAPALAAKVRGISSHSANNY